MEAETSRTTPITETTANWQLPSEALNSFLPVDTETNIPVLTPQAESLFGFHIGSLNLLVSSHTYCEVIEQLQVNPLPNVEAWFSGLLNLRGNLVPVIDLKLLLGDASTDHNKQTLFAIGQGDKTMAFWIDGLPEIQTVFSHALKQLPPHPPILQHCILSAYLRDEQIWFHIQFDELFKTLGHQYAGEEVAP